MRIIAGAHKGRSLKTVEGPGYRPAMAIVREAVFSMLASRGLSFNSTHVLDLFAGSGALAFEALSRGAEKAYFVENNPKAAACIAENARKLDITASCHILQEDVVRFVGRPPQKRNLAPFPLIFIDPPYAFDRLKNLITVLLQYGWLAENGFLVAEVERHNTLEADAFPGLETEADRVFGQTRILLWSKAQPADLA